MEISVVIPIYNVTQNAIKHLPSIIKKLSHKYKDFELLFIVDNLHINDDINKLQNIVQHYSNVKVHFLNKNYGQHFATLCGYYLAKADFIVCIDEDMCNYVTEICNTDVYKNVDVFYFHYNKNDMYKSNVRRFFSNTYKFVINKVVNLKQHSTFRIISKELRNKILEEKHIYWNLDVMIFDNTNKIANQTLYIPDISDSNTAYNYKKLSQIAFEIAYEHNNILMNSLLVLLPTLLFYFWSENIANALVFYIVSIAFISTLFVIKKRTTKSTVEKISNALMN
jgi:undecaprenyl-phosphate 4-deoxy-4-formamido-L-arabinose transferase